MSAEKPAPRPWWEWPAQWFRDDSFWRDVAARSLATLVAGGLAYLFALGSGYISRPETVEVIRGVLIALIPLVIVYVAYLVFRHVLVKLPPRPRVAAAVTLVPVLGVIAWLLSDAIVSLVARL
ncbi:hypothetical protein BH683_005715 [Williamsia sp. 1138]|uniref:hypothetical protein n=1 Tax=Williamsia sp. 1138 TaxID=1903117 RepID=UPI000A11CC35|nr:hypothetical protein [Williamsia sp. 1138]OZG30096.1 hypothetical protein BH683_005715 [Williamsia sp. 1138]